MAIRAIQTQYKGYNFRSRTEARWAVFFEHMRMPWVYEPQGFELPGGVRYLPDFFLPDFHGPFGSYVEVKPSTGGDFRKAKLMALNCKASVILLAGEPDLVTFQVAPPSALNPRYESDCNWCETIGAFWSGKYSPGGSNYPGEYELWWDGCNGIGQRLQQHDTYPNILRAINAARSSRFEHGEVGATL